MTASTLRRHSARLSGVPIGLLASVAFNDYPLPLHIRGVRESHARLFDLLTIAHRAPQHFLRVRRLHSGGARANGKKSCFSTICCHAMRSRAKRNIG